MRLIAAALIVIVLCWGPLLVVGLLDPRANPIGLGMLAMLGTFVASVLLATAAALALIRALRSI
jgi:hypothetical protein